MAPSPSHQTYAPTSKNIYGANNVYGSYGETATKGQQQPVSLAAPASNFNDYMRSSDLVDESSNNNNRAIYVSSKMVSQQMENLSLTTPPGGNNNVENPSPMPAANGKSFVEHALLQSLWAGLNIISGSVARSYLSRLFFFCVNCQARK